MHAFVSNTSAAIVDVIGACGLQRGISAVYSKFPDIGDG